MTSGGVEQAVARTQIPTAGEVCGAIAFAGILWPRPGDPFPKRGAIFDSLYWQDFSALPRLYAMAARVLWTRYALQPVLAFAAGRFHV